MAVLTDSVINLLLVVLLQKNMDLCGTGCKLVFFITWIKLYHSVKPGKKTVFYLFYYTEIWATSLILVLLYVNI